ncbi:MAG: hypothetical protein V3T17_13930 [Pseudomonadales bacterium]
MFAVVIGATTACYWRHNCNECSIRLDFRTLLAVSPQKSAPNPHVSDQLLSSFYGLADACIEAEHIEKAAALLA